MCAMSESEISVPIEISAAALRTASRSSGKILEKSDEAAFVRKPGKKTKCVQMYTSGPDANEAYPYVG